MKTVLTFCILLLLIVNPLLNNNPQDIIEKEKIHNETSKKIEYQSQFSVMQNQNYELSPVKDKEDQEAKKILKKTFLDFLEVLGIH